MITDLAEDDIGQVLLIADKCLGNNFLKYETVVDYIRDPRKIIKVHRTSNEIVGYVKGKAVENSELKRYLLKTDSLMEEELSGNGFAGLFESLCINQNHQRKSIGMSLALELVKSFRTMNDIGRIYTTVWKSKYEANSKKLVEKIGFKQITEIPGYWFEDSAEKQYLCPDCGHPPCKCSMLFYVL